MKVNFCYRRANLYKNIINWEFYIFKNKVNAITWPLIIKQKRKCFNCNEFLEEKKKNQWKRLKLYIPRWNSLCFSPGRSRLLCHCFCISWFLFLLLFSTTTSTQHRPLRLWVIGVVQGLGFMPSEISGPWQSRWRSWLIIRGRDRDGGEGPFNHSFSLFLHVYFFSLSSLKTSMALERGERA